MFKTLIFLGCIFGFVSAAFSDEIKFRICSTVFRQKFAANRFSFSSKLDCFPLFLSHFCLFVTFFLLIFVLSFFIFRIFKLNKEQFEGFFKF